MHVRRISLRTMLLVMMVAVTLCTMLLFNAVYGKYFTEKPARSCVAVKTLPKNVLVEVEVIAAL